MNKVTKNFLDWMDDPDKQGPVPWDWEGKMLGHIPFIHYCTSEAKCPHIKKKATA